MANAVGEASVRFTRDDAQRAADDWGFNCGPGALCAVLGMTPNEIRHSLGDFEQKRYTNPTLMFEILDRLGADWRLTYRSNKPSSGRPWPRFGLVRIQWAGPWTQPGVPMRVRYRHTHWVAHNDTADRYGVVFDINAICVGGWLPFNEWANELTPWLLRQCEPKANGTWWPTHCIEVIR